METIVERIDMKNCPGCDISFGAANMEQLEHQYLQHYGCTCTHHSRPFVIIYVCPVCKECCYKLRSDPKSWPSAEAFKQYVTRKAHAVAAVRIRQWHDDMKNDIPFDMESEITSESVEN